MELDLSIEQQFELNKTRIEAEGASRENLIALVIQAHRLVMMKDNAVRDLLKQPLFDELSDIG